MCAFALTRGDHDHDALGRHSARDEQKRVTRGWVEPMCVVDHAQDRRLLGRSGKQAETAREHEKGLALIAVAESERDSECIRLRRRGHGRHEDLV